MYIKKPDSGRRKDKKIYFSQFCMSTVGIVCSFITVYSVSHIVAGCISPDRVLCCQSNTAHRNDNQDGHLKITQSHNIVTQPPHPEEKEAKKKRSKYLLLLHCSCPFPHSSSVKMLYTTGACQHSSVPWDWLLVRHAICYFLQIWNKIPPKSYTG